MSGRVVLVGAGPGDPDLLTVRARRELERVEVLLYDALIEPAILELAPAGCERIDVGKRGDGTRGVPQEEICDLLVRKARSGARVVRLKGGDPFVFGRGGEEASALAAAGIPFEVVPGISSAIAVPAYAGIPVTDRRSASSVAIVTGHRGGGEHDWEGLARSAETLVVLMGTAWLDDIARRIGVGRDPSTPAAVIERGATPRQRVVTGPLSTIAARVREAGLRAPTVLVVGEVVQLRETLRWFEARPLFGRRALVLRERAQARELALELRRRAAEPIVVPLLTLEPLGPADALAEAASADWIVFTSANAIRFAADRLPAAARERAARGELRVGCIGPPTARAAEAAGLPVHVVPPDRSLPEALVEAMEGIQTLRGRTVLFPRAESVRPTLVRELAARGARVRDVVLYRTVPDRKALGPLQEALRAGVDAVALTSPSTVDGLVELLGAEEVRALSRRAILACIGPTTAEALRERGVEPGAQARVQSVEGLVDAIEEAFREGVDGVS